MPEEPTIHWTEGKLKMVIAAKRAGAAEDLADRLSCEAATLFINGYTKQAIAVRDVVKICKNFAALERFEQERLEKEHGRYDG